MKYIVVSVDKNQDSWTVIEGIFDTYIAARRSIQGRRVKGKLLDWPMLLRKWPNMQRSAFMGQYVNGKMKSNAINPPITIFQKYNGRYVITICAANNL
jgi:hypothetical protein